MNYEPTQFVGRVAGSTTTTVLKSTGGRDLVFYEDSGDALISGVVQTVSGAKYNVNGTWQAASVPGQYRAVVMCRGANMRAANLQADGLYDIAGASGTLYGIEYVGSTVSTHTCSVVVGPVRPISMFDRVGASLGRAHAIQVEIVFERLGDWS